MITSIISGDYPLSHENILVLNNCEYDYNRSQVVCPDEKKHSVQLKLDWNKPNMIFLLTSKLLKNQAYRGRVLSGALHTRRDGSDLSQSKIAHNQEMLRKVFGIPNMYRMSFLKMYDFIVSGKGLESYGNRWITYRLTDLINNFANRHTSFNRITNKIDDFWLADLSINFGRKIFIIDALDDNDAPVQYIGCLTSLLNNLKFHAAKFYEKFTKLITPTYHHLILVPRNKLISPSDNRKSRSSSSRITESKKTVNPMGLFCYQKDDTFDWNIMRIVLKYHWDGTMKNDSLLNWSTMIDFIENPMIRNRQKPHII